MLASRCSSCACHSRQPRHPGLARHIYFVRHRRARRYLLRLDDLAACE